MSVPRAEPSVAPTARGMMVIRAADIVLSAPEKRSTSIVTATPAAAGNIPVNVHDTTMIGTGARGEARK